MGAVWFCSPSFTSLRTPADEPILICKMVVSRTLYLPDFLESELQSGDDIQVINKRLLGKNWLTTGLVEEISSLFPKAADISSSSGERNKEMFVDNCTQLFEKGRIFASFKQLDQTADMFLEAWAVSKSHNGKRISCSFSQDTRKKKAPVVPLEDPPISSREHSVSLKEQTKCPFKILYSYVNHKEINKKPGIFYRVKITTVDPNHTCQMSVAQHRLALQRGGKLEINVAGMQDILSLLSEKPRVCTHVLRPMLLKYVPKHKGLSSEYINNFRKRVMLYLLKHPDHEELTYDQAIHLTSKRMIAADELTDLDDPFVRQNFTAMLRLIMQEGSGTWQALLLMDELKIKSPGFDYRIAKDDEGRPTGIMYMTAQMRYHARRYGHVLCLDAQKRQMNSSGWPYIAPVVKDNEMKVALAAESIVIEENHGFYIWIIKSMAEIEPRFILSDIAIIFADQKITTTVLQELGITETCTLRGDFHHMLHEVWPEQFHSSVYPSLKKFLSAMLLSRTLEEWYNAYTCGVELVQSKPRMLSSLNAIYNNPSQFAGYYLRGIEGNLLMNGDVAAEQNHSGVVAYLGQGASYSVAEQITHLLNRQKNLDKLRRQKEDDQNIHANRYESPYFLPGQKADDQEAKKTLSGYAWKELWSKTLKRSFRLQGERNIDDSFQCWPTTQTHSERDEESTVVIKEGERCMCERRIAFRIQCEHEYVQDGGFDLQKMHHSWYHRQTFNRLLPERASVFNNTLVLQEDPLDSASITNEGDIDEQESTLPSISGELPTGVTANNNSGLSDLHMDEETGQENCPPVPPPNSDKVTFGEIVARAGELAKTCDGHHSLMRTVLCNINQMIERVRSDQGIHILIQVLSKLISLDRLLQTPIYRTNHAKRWLVQSPMPKLCPESSLGGRGSTIHEVKKPIVGRLPIPRLSTTTTMITFLRQIIGKGHVLCVD
jgi:hypothetical protein